MKRVPVSDRAIGKILAKTIYGEQGTPLLKTGTMITKRYVDVLYARGILGIYVMDPYNPNAHHDEDILADETRREATSAYKTVLNQSLDNRMLPIKELEQIVKDIIENAMHASELSAGLVLLRDYDQFTFTHSVNVCAYSVALGHQIGLEYNDLVEVGTGTLLHDIGKIRSPMELNKMYFDEMGEEERSSYQKHPEEGYNILRANPGLSAVTTHISLQHHEHWDGTGFPRSLAGEDIHLYGRIVCICDAFDNLTSKREAGESVQDHVAAAHILKRSGSLYDPKLAAQFLKILALYPVDSIIRLSNGLYGVVSRTIKTDPLRPWIRVIANREGNLVEPYEIPLEDNRNLCIKQVLHDYPVMIKYQLEKMRKKLNQAGYQSM